MMLIACFWLFIVVASNEIKVTLLVAPMVFYKCIIASSLKYGGLFKNLYILPELSASVIILPSSANYR